MRRALTFVPVAATTWSGRAQTLIVFVMALAFVIAALGCATGPPLSRLTILPGEGVKSVRVGQAAARILKHYGRPDRVRRSPSGRMFDYRKSLGIDFFVTKRENLIGEIHFNPGYRGRTPDGIGLGSRLESVLKKSGGALKRVTETRDRVHAHGRNRVLVRVKEPKADEKYFFNDACRGIGYFIGKDDRVSQIMVYKRSRSCACRAAAVTASGRGRDALSKAKQLAISAGRGTDRIRVGDKIAKVVRLFGKPERRKVSGHTVWLVYWKRLKMDFMALRKTGEVIEIRFNKGYAGRDRNGIGLCSPLKELLRKRGGARKTVRVPRNQFLSHGSDRVLYEITYKGVFQSYLFRDGCRGILYWFDRDKLATQIVVHRREISCECLRGRSTAGGAQKQLVISAGGGNTRIRVGDKIDKAVRVLGQPERRVVTRGMVWLVYWKRHKMDLLAYKETKEIAEIRFNIGYKGRLSNGVGLCSKLKDVLKSSGGALKTVRARVPKKLSWSRGSNRVLYEITYKGVHGSYLFRDHCRGILYWFNLDKRVIQIVTSRPQKACACRRQSSATTARPPRSLRIIPRRGSGEVQLGDPIVKVTRRLGTPDQRWKRRGLTGLSYHAHRSMTVWVDNSTGKVVSIRFFAGYRGRLSNGIGLCSQLREVLKKSGGALKTVKAEQWKPPTQKGDRVLYQFARVHKGVAYLFRDHRSKISFRFGRDKRVSHIFVGSIPQLYRPRLRPRSRLRPRLRDLLGE
jgi:hypothetical protein